MGSSNRKAPVLGIDLGGTKILAGVVNEEGEILGSAKRPTKPKDGLEAVVDRVAKTAREAVESAGLEMDDILAACCGSPGPLDPDKGIVYYAPNLAGWENVPLAEMLGDALDVPTVIENDVNMGTLGEYALGAGRGTQHMVGVFVGTGIGGGIILNGKLWQGWRRAAAEVGHMVLLPDGPVCGCGNRGCAESLASRTAIERDIRLGVAAGRSSVIPELLKASGRDRLTSGVLADAIEQGDPLTREVIGRAAYYLALLVSSLVNFIDPEMVVLGGGVVEALGEAYVSEVREVAYQYFVNKRGARDVRIVAAKLGDDAGVLGSAVYARQRMAK